MPTKVAATKSLPGLVFINFPNAREMSEASQIPFQSFFILFWDKEEKKCCETFESIRGNHNSVRLQNLKIY